MGGINVMRKQIIFCGSSQVTAAFRVYPWMFLTDIGFAISDSNEDMQAPRLQERGYIYLQVLVDAEEVGDGISSIFSNHQTMPK